MTDEISEYKQLYRLYMHTCISKTNHWFILE